MATSNFNAVATAALLVISTLAVIQQHVLASATSVPDSVVKRSSPSNSPVGKCWEGASIHNPLEGNTVWICRSGNWVAFNLTRSTGTTEVAAASSCKEIKESLCGDKTPVPDGTYWINLVDACGKEERTVQVWCDMTTCGGGWTMVWKHSYLEVGQLTQNMYYFSNYYKECQGLNTGWCNIPFKSNLQPRQMMIAAYHNKKLVYAYQGDFNEMIDVDWTGGRLENYQKCEDHCIHRRNNGIRPAPSSHDRDAKLLGLNFDKTTPTTEFGNCDTMHGTFANPRECRWHDCNLPHYISAKIAQTQMTMAIYVR